MSSLWADQEAGFAQALKKVIVPIMPTGGNPHGFLNRFQAIKRKKGGAEAIAEKVLWTLLGDNSLAESTRNCIIKSFGESVSFTEAIEKSNVILSINNYSNAQLNKICEVIISNKQISGCGAINGKFRMFIKNLKTRIEGDLFKRTIKTLG